MDHQKPNKIVKIVFEVVDTDDEDVSGCRVYLEMPDRPITEKILIADDCTIPEKWAANVFDAIREDMLRMAHSGGGQTMSTPKPEDMN